jgi:predicted nucleic acid-binding protein
VVIAELAFGISKIRPDERAQRLADGLEAWRRRLTGCIFAFTEEPALSYGELMGEAARAGRPMSACHGRIAGIARIHSTPLATRNVGRCPRCWLIRGGAECGNVSSDRCELLLGSVAHRSIRDEFASKSVFYATKCEAN